MSDEIQNPRSYAHLPEELLGKILENIPATVDKMNRLFDIQDEPIKAGMDDLKKRGMIELLSSTDYSTSLMAADGGMILEKMTGTDLLLAVAVGVEGLGKEDTQDWGSEKNQYYQFQTVLPLDEANSRLVQGIMFLMELSVLANADHEIRILDGTHFTPIIKINSLLSADGEKIGSVYTDALKDFLKETYKKIIPDIPDIIKAAFNDDKIISLAKYSSSRDVIDAFLSVHKIHVDDKTFFSLALSQDEYLKPLSVGQSKEERRKTWDDLRINSNLELPDDEQEKLNKAKKNILRMPESDIEKSAKIKERVISAREIQKNRFKKFGRDINTNSEMNVKDLGNMVKLADDVRTLLDRSAESLGLSARAYHRVIKIARTIADLEGSVEVNQNHILEAIQYRPKVNS